MQKAAVARIATIGFIALIVFQTLLALGLPLGRAAYGGQYESLPMELRVSSVVSLAIYTLAIYIIRTRAGLTQASANSRLARWGSWFFAGFLLFGTLLNFASSSPLERYLWAPFALILAAMCFIVARGET